MHSDGVTNSVLGLDPKAIISKPFLKWAGGKSKIVPQIAEALGAANRLVEPFVGSGAVFMGTSYSKYLLCDSNRDLISLYSNLKLYPTETIHTARKLFSSKTANETSFYDLRDEFNSLKSEDIRKSAIFLYLNKHAFNGLCRYNRSGGFNVPYGHYSSPSFPEREISLFAQKCKIADFKCIDFKDAFSEIKKGDVVYCDPPYIPLSRTASFTAYSTNGFGEKEQVDLANAAESASEKNIRVVISNHDTPLARELYQRAKIRPLQVHRSISSKAVTRGRVDEVLATFSGS